MGRFISSATAGSAQIGEIKEFSSGAVPTGYLPLDGSCVCKATYQELYNFVGNLEPPLYCGSDLNYPPSLCGYTVIGGSCYCFCGNALTALSSWGSDCVVLYQAQLACCCCSQPGNGCCAGLILICFNTGACCGVMCATNLNPRCGGTACQACNINAVYTFYQNNTRYIGINTCISCSQGHATYVFNFDQKCFVCTYCIASCGYCSICNSSVHLIAYTVYCCLPQKLILPSVLSCVCLCAQTYTTCTIGGSWNSFGLCGFNFVGYNSNFCCGREPAYFIAFGQACYGSSYSSCSCPGVMGLNLQTSQATITTCCWSCCDGIGCCMNLGTTCGGWSLNGYSMTPGKWCSANSAVFTQVANWRLCVYQGCQTTFNNWRYACTVAISLGSGTGNIITSTALCPVAPACTSGNICSGVSKLFWNEKCNTFYGTSVFVNCTPNTPVGVSAIYTSWDFEYNTTTKLPPLNHCSTTYATTILSPSDAQGNYPGGTPIRYDVGKIVVYGFSTVGNSSPLFLLPAAPHPIPNIKYYIKT